MEKLLNTSLIFGVFTAIPASLGYQKLSIAIFKISALTFIIWNVLGLAYLTKEGKRYAQTICDNTILTDFDSLQ